jgi:hypothetical protein
MIDTLLGFIDNLGVSYSFILPASAGFAIGSAVWFGWGPGHPVPRTPREPWDDRADRGDQMARMTVTEFFQRVTLGTNQGRLFLWLSAANLALAAALPAFDEKRAASPMAPFLWFWPLLLFVYHILSFYKFGSSWFSMVMLSVVALIPGWRILGA